MSSGLRLLGHRLRLARTWSCWPRQAAIPPASPSIQLQQQRWGSDRPQGRTPEEVKKWVFDRTDESKNMWFTWGYDTYNKSSDRFRSHFVVSALTGYFLFMIFYPMYYPDPKLRDWHEREAYIVLRERERNGQILIDPNLVDPAKLELPTDEELGDFRLII